MKQISFRAVGIGFLGSVLLLVGGMCVLRPANAAPTQAPLVVYGVAEIPQEPDLPPAQAALLAAASTLVEDHKEAFLGAIPAPYGRVVVVAGSGAAQVLAEATLGASALLEVRLGATTIEGAWDLGEQLQEATPSLEQKTFAWGGAPDIGGLKVVVGAELTASERQSIESFATARNLPVKVEVLAGVFGYETLDSRATDGSPYAGGARYGVGTGSGASATIAKQCTMGLGYRKNGNDFVLTAGHCHPRDVANDYLWILNGAGAKSDYAGRATGSTYDKGVGTVPTGADSGNHGDLAIANVSEVGNASGDHIWWGAIGSSFKIPVRYVAAPAIGEALCFSGSVSGGNCGVRVYDTNTMAYEVDPRTGERIGTMRAVDLSLSDSIGDCPELGDSGGPVILNHQGAEEYASARGILSGGGETQAGQCLMISTGVEEATQAWGGSLKVAP